MVYGARYPFTHFTNCSSFYIMIGIIVEEVNEWLNKAERTDLATLARIEENVMNRYSGFDGFEAFGYGSFLKFLTKHKVLRETIAEVGGIARSGNGGTGLGLRVSLDSVLDFISQCGTEPTPVRITILLILAFKYEITQTKATSKRRNTVIRVLW